MSKLKLKIMLGAVMVSLFFINSAAEANVALVTNMTSQEAGPQKVALESFKDKFSASAGNVNMVQFDLAGIGDNDAVVEEIRGFSPEMIVAFGFRTASLMKEEFDETPIIFSMVLNPVTRGLAESAERAGNNLTGVSLNLPVLPQFSLITNILPDLEKIGIMYDPQNSAGIIKEARAAADQLGLSLVKYTVTEAREISGALEYLRDEGADIIWALPDSTVYSGASVRQVLLFSLRNRIPVAGFSESFARAGALVGIYHDYEIIGEQTARLSLKVLGGQSPATIPLERPSEIIYSLSQRVMDNFSLGIQSDIKQEAKHIFE